MQIFLMEKLQNKPMIYQSESDYLAYHCACSDKLPCKGILSQECAEHLSTSSASASQNPPCAT